MNTYQLFLHFLKAKHVILASGNGLLTVNFQDLNDVLIQFKAAWRILW